MVYLRSTLHNQHSSNNSDKMADNLDLSNFDACHYSNPTNKNRSTRRPRRQRNCTLTLFLILFISINSLTLFLEGVQCNSQVDDFYKILEVTPQASKADIKKAFRRLSKQYHPDKNKGDEEAANHFKKINRAYEVLADDELRQVYNQGGMDDLERHEQ
jgi:preprotein translocase subunit Sec63